MSTITNLMRAEFGRLSARRFTQIMLVLLLAAFATTLASTMISTHRPTSAELQRAEQRAAALREEISVERQLCQLAQLPGATPQERARYFGGCADLDPASVDTGDFLPGVFSFSRSIRDLLYFLGAFLGLFGFLVGASFVGAELTSGGMTNLLLWQPQRLRVLGAKLGTLLAGVTGLAVVATVLYVGAFWLLAELGGNPGNQTGGFWGNLALLCLRGFVLALIATALGFGVATLGGHTSAAVGVLAGYAVVWEIGARIVMEIASANRPELWMFSSYLAAWMDGRIELSARNACLDSTTSCSTIYHLTWWHAGLVFVALLAGCVGGAFTLFQRRDLT
jgi:ABC-2 type transport system permease protein